MKYITFLFSILFVQPIPSQSILINEVMSSNISTLADINGEYHDWLELYNPTDTIINLLNYSISDAIEDRSKWRFPEHYLLPGEYLIIFCSGKNIIINEFHTNFQIKSSGENLWLMDSTEQVIDKVEAVKLKPDISIGRKLSEISEWLFYSSPTPGESNSTDGFIGAAPEPKFSLDAGFYNNELSLKITNVDTSLQTYYTLDGSEPNESSLLFYNNILIDSTTVVRAKSIKTGLLPSNTITSSYFINEYSTLPVISLSSDPDNFFDDEVGIYVEGTNGIIGNCTHEPMNFNRDWERPIHLEFFENGDQKINIDAGVKIYGGCTRIFPQKSLLIIARNKYGSSTIPYEIFPELPFLEYQSIILRNSGNDNTKTLIRDALMHRLVENLDLETQAYRPAILFLNGEYWGIHNIRERNNKEYLKQHKNVDIENVDILRRSYIILEGDNIHYNEMYNFIESTDLSVDSNYNYVKTLMEIDNYLDYLLSEMYFANTDWYPGNMKFWRPKDKDGKWRWILFDTDLGFHSNEFARTNMVEWVSRSDKEPSAIFNGLIENDLFKQKFINRCADYLNTIFSPEVVLSKIEEYSNLIEYEIPRHSKRWNNFINTWEYNVNILKDYANIRPEYMRHNFNEEFNLGGTGNIKLSMNIYEAGVVKLNSLEINKFPWQGEYFFNNLVQVSVECNNGYRFSYWSNNDTIYSTRNKIEFLPSEISSLTAVMVHDTIGENDVVINEINYKSSPYYNTEDWIELFNISDTTIDLSGWYLKDENDSNSFVLKNNTLLKKNEYLVICEDTNSFKKIFPKINNKVGNLNFKFNNDGELLRLYNSSKYLVDSVRYNSKTPWPVTVYGKGKTLELKDPTNDNGVFTSWNESTLFGGTPGNSNSFFLKNKIYINEFSADNSNLIFDETGESEDWIELFNKSDMSITLRDIYVTDDLIEMQKFSLASISSFNPNSFLLLWADDETQEGVNHLNFKLNRNGEQIGLFQSNGLETFLLDSLTFGIQSQDKSFGRYPDAYERWKKFDKPTPLLHNSNLLNHPPFIRDGLVKEHFIDTDSSLTINLWEYVEDVETPDSLLKYTFEVTSNSIEYNYFINEGKLELLLKLSENEVSMLYIKIEDDENLTYIDSIKFLQSIVLTNENTESIPSTYKLSQNYPNPFNPMTTIKFAIPVESLVLLTIYNNLGEKIAVIVDEKMEAGYYEQVFMSDEYSSGIYFYQLIANEFVSTKKMIILK